MAFCTFLPLIPLIRKRLFNLLSSLSFAFRRVFASSLCAYALFGFNYGEIRAVLDFYFQHSSLWRIRDVGRRKSFGEHTTNTVNGNGRIGPANAASSLGTADRHSSRDVRDAEMTTPKQRATRERRSGDPSPER